MPIEKQIADIALSCNVDVLLLAEFEGDLFEITRILNESGEKTFLIPPARVESRIKVIIALPADTFTHINEDGHFAAWNTVTPLGNNLLVVAVHLVSKLWGAEPEQLAESQRVATRIRELERQVGHSNTVVIGDFNMAPFENAMVNITALNAVMDRRVAAKGSRTYNKEAYPFFYNPMWSLLGDLPAGPAGSFYRPQGVLSYFWYLFDQVLIRPGLIDALNPDVKLHTTIREQSLLGRAGPRQGWPDHLPLTVTLDI